MVPAPTRARVLAATILALGVALPGSVTSATAEDDAWSATRPAERTVPLGGDDRARLVRGSAGTTAVEALPRPDGSTPGLVLGTGPSGTTLRSQAHDAPVLLRGTAPRAAPRVAAEDLVELHLEAVGRDGRPSPADVMVYDVDSGAVEASRWLPAESDACSTEAWAASTCVLVPPGTYSVTALVTTNPAGVPSTEVGFAAQSLALVGDPEVEITADRTITLDARLARRVRVTTPGHRTSVAHGGALELGYRRTAANGLSASREAFPGTLLDDAFYVQPAGPVTVGGLDTLARLRLEAPDIAMSGSGLRLRPEYFEAHWFSDVDSDWPVWDGRARLRVAYVGRATPQRISERDLTGAVAVVERSDRYSVAALSNAAARAGAELVAVHNDGPGDDDDPNGTGVALRVPTVRLTRAEGRALDRLPHATRIRVDGEAASPYVYDLVLKESGEIPDPSYAFTTDELATQVHRFHGQPTKPWTATDAAYHYQPGDTFSISRSFPLRDVPRRRTEYRIPDPDTRWTYGVTVPEFPYNHQFPAAPVSHLQLNDPGLTAYVPGEREVHRFGTAPLVAAPDDPLERSGDQLRVDLHGFVDGDGNTGPAYSDPESGFATDLRVLADGVLVGQTDALPSGVAALPAGPSTVEVVFTTDNPQQWAELSTRTETRWTFASEPVPADTAEVEPVIVADYDVPVDLRNRVRREQDGQAAFEVTVAHQAGSTPAPLEVTVDASYDGGETWRPATVTTDDGGRHRVVLPRGSGLVSLRLHAADTGGSMLDQTIVDAFEVPRRRIR